MAKSLLSRKRTRNFIPDLNITEDLLNPDENVIKFGWENIHDFRLNGALYCMFDMSSLHTSSLGIHYKLNNESDCVILIINFKIEKDGHKTIKCKKLFLKERLKEIVYYSVEQIFFGYSSSQSRIIIYSHIDKHISKLNSCDCDPLTQMKFIKSISCLVTAGKGFVHLYKYLNHSLYFLKRMKDYLKENEQIVKMDTIPANKLFILTEECLFVWSFVTKGHRELLKKKNSLSNILEFDENTFKNNERECLRNSINEELLIELPNHHNSDLTCCLVSIKHKLIFTGSRDGCILVWSLEKIDKKTCLQLHELNGHLAQITGLELDPSGKFLISTSSDGNCQAWFIEMSQTIYNISLNEQVTNISHVFENIYSIKVANGIRFYRFYFNAILFHTLNSSCVYLKKLSGFMNYPNRLVCIQKNGTLSLLSPVYGAPILQIIQSDLRNEEILNIVRNSKQSVLYILIESGKIIVATELSELKPMYTIMAETDQEKITSIEIIKMSEALGYAESSDDYFLLFFGHLSGEISLINTYNVRMTPIQAHLGPVYQLVASKRGHRGNKCIKSDVSVLISSGKIDKTIKLWKVRYISSAHYIELLNVFELNIEQTCISSYMIKNFLAFVTNESR
jgi:WD40 repeat protein